MTTITGIPKRSEVDPASTWALEDLFPTVDAWEAAFEAVKDYPDTMEKYRGHLGDDGHTLYQYLKTGEEYSRKILRLFGYVSLKADEDTANTENQARKGRFMSWLNEAESHVAFEDPEIMAISDEKLASMMEEEPGLPLYRRYFDRLRARRAHTLSEAEEALLAGAGEMADAPEEIYASFLYADLKFKSARDTEGALHEVTNGSFISLMQSPDAELRKNTFENYYDTYHKYRNTLASMLAGQVKQATFFRRARHYDSARQAALSRTEVPESVYDNLIAAVHDHMDPMVRYMELRRKLLHVEKLHMYDIYMPLLSGSTRDIPFEEAKADVLGCTALFGEEYGRVIRRAFDERWIDIYENQGKRSGAYSSFTQEHPYVLMNYKNDLDGEFTLAHELGHSLHSYMSHTYQPQAYGNYVIFVAEVASTCNEALLMQYLLGRTRDKRERAVLLNHFLEQFRTTLYRQTMFAEFEREIYAMAERGETLTADSLSELYRSLNIRYYGNDICVDHGIDMEWARIPHFYYNFYVYQYATGFSAAIALSRKLLTGGEEAVAAYLKFLQGGCSADPITLLRMAGVDMTTPEPVSEALEYFGQLVDEFAQLMQELEG